MRKNKKSTPNSAKMQIFKISELQPAGYNPRTISDDALDALKHSLSRFGCVEPIVVNIRGNKKRIVGGHQRHKALLKLGIKESLCVTVDLSEKEEKLLNLTLNNPALQGEFIEQIDSYINSLEGEIDSQDFIDFRINQLRQELGNRKTGLKDDDEVPAIPEKAITRPGDVWILGEHRLICGDSQKVQDIFKLMQNKEYATLCFTSAPYNMKEKRYANYKDDLRSQEYISFNIAVAANIQKVLKGFLFWNLSYNKNSRWEFIEVYYKLIKIAGYKFLESIVWDKGWAMPITNSTCLTRQYENILVAMTGDAGFELEYCFVGTNLDRWIFNKTTQAGLSNYWRVPVGSKTNLKNHKACFPVALPLKAIELMSKPGDIVIEPFSGSGTTIIACEKLDRKCRAIELDPIYCDVAVKRWEAWTGKKAKRE